MPPPFKKWTDVDDRKLEEAQSDIVGIEHTHLGHLVLGFYGRFR
jgi:hypothetical protein